MRNRRVVVIWTETDEPPARHGRRPGRVVLAVSGYAVAAAVGAGSGALLGHLLAWAIR